jgi:AcrR family transcriptional regulator
MAMNDTSRTPLKRAAAPRRAPLAGGSAERRAEIGQERRSRTRQLLMTSAARLIASRGADGLTIDDFIKEAGMARGTFYNYYTSREELIEALWQHVGKTPFRMINKIIANNPDPAQRLVGGFQMMLRRAHEDHIWGWLVFRLTATASDLASDLRSFPLVDIRAGLKSGRFAGIDEDAACDYFMGVEMMALKAVIVAERSHDYAAQCGKAILKGLGLSDNDAHAVVSQPLPEYS